MLRSALAVLFDPLVAAARLHRRRPGFAIITIFAVGCAIAINVTVFAVVDAVRAPLYPVENAEQLVSPEIYSHVRSENTVRLFFEEIAAGGVPSFQGVTTYSWNGVNAHAESDKNWRDVYVFTVADNYFAVLRPKLDAGRWLGPADRDASVQPVVISNVVERALFPGGGSAVGKEFRLDDRIVTVVGVMPRRAAYPKFVDVWKVGPPAIGAFSGNYMLARLKPDAIRSQMRNELGVVRSHADPPGTTPRTESRIETPSAFETTPRMRAFHWALIAASVAVLLVACFNVANLQLARGFERANELALRAAVGASRGQLLGLLLAEMLVLSVAGAGVGLLLGAWAVQLVTSSIPIIGSQAGGLVEPQWSWRVFAATGVAMSCALMIAGVASAATLQHVRSSSVLRSGVAAGIGRQERAAGGFFMVAQIALSLTLCIHSSLLTRTLVELQRIDLGFESEHLVVGSIVVRTEASGNRARSNYADVVRQRLLAIPDAMDAAATIRVGRPADERVSSEDAGGTVREFPASRWSYRVVTPQYFRTLGVRVRRGRDFNEAGESVPVAIVNELAARRWWLGPDPLGRMVKMGSAQSNQSWIRVVGVVPDIRLVPRLEEDVPPLVVVSHALDTVPVGKGGFATFGFVARTRGNAAEFAQTVRQRHGEGMVGPGIRTWANSWERANNLDELKARERFVASLFWTFAFLALLLALVGVYTLTTYTVSRRRTELGVRLALGATPGSLVLERLREGNLIALVGIAAGLLLAFWSVEMLNVFLMGLTPFEPMLFAAVAGLMLLVVLLAALPSAIRSGATNPVTALRNE